MGPARFHCATLLLTDIYGLLTAIYRLLLQTCFTRIWNSLFTLTSKQSFFVFKQTTRSLNHIPKVELRLIVNKAEWLGSPANIKGANKDAKI